MSDTTLSAAPARRDSPTPALIAGVLGFFVITLDAVVVNIALPRIRHDLGGGMTGLQWVIDGYTLMFAALLLSSGSLSDRVGARRALAGGVTVFALASLACGLAPSLDVLVTARFVQGAAAAVTTPSTVALIGQAYSEPRRRAWALAMWSMGGAVASSTGPVLGGLLTTLSWRLIFLLNLPVAAVALVLLARTAPSPKRPAPFDWWGQATAIGAMGGLTYGAIEAGAIGPGASRVTVAFAVAVVCAAAFVVIERRTPHPMVPPDMFRSAVVPVSIGIGFAYMVGYWGLPFVMSLYFQEQRGLSAVAAGGAFLPMMLSGAILTPFTARLLDLVPARVCVASGMGSMALGLVGLALLPASVPIWVPMLLMVLVGVAGPLVMPPMNGVLLGAVPNSRAGTVNGVFNAGRQVGGALSVAVFGALLATPATLPAGVRASVLIAAVIALTAVASTRALPGRR
ncbi:MFS transporter [Tsukamurella soli]|uniref:MFS transporter n=1 Tax=Tsukamurella soli TaxID=644556 RepID=A0ABP8J2S1_9ACTN